jgi:alkanesulfonate monooxygenase SsuD/methylene tetrahydromethanopterin reductase-like flavin-dependent oxidoreductase (luciferase family)
MTTVAFGVQGSGPLINGAPAPEHYRRIAEAAEAAGFDSLWAGDHVAFHHPLLDVTVALATFAAVTERIWLGAGVLLLPLRAPALVAREFASLDYLSRGRVILGVGVGGEHPADFEAVGVPIRERGARTNESMRSLRELFPRQAPAPAQPGGPPLWVGGRSQAAIRRAGRLGDGWIPIWVSPERFAEGVAQLAGKTAAVVLPALVGGSTEQVRQYLSRRYATEFSSHAVDRYCVVGSPAECAERTAAYVEAGAQHIVFHPAIEPVGLHEQVERLAEVAHAAAR